MRAAIRNAAESIEYLNKELAKTTVVELRQAIYRVIEDQVKQSMLANVQREYAFRFIDRAIAPEKRFSPRRAVMTVFGALIGLAAAFAAVAIRYRIRGRDSRSRNQPLKISPMLEDRSILITGGTGSFGSAFVRRVLRDHPGVRRLVIYSRDELKQYEMSQKFSEKEFPCLRYFLGDVRDQDRLRRALEGIDIVVHAAALKQVPAAEYNPFECIKTNVLGAQNVIEASLDAGRAQRGGAVHRQGRGADQPVRRHQALLRQAVHRRQQHQGRARPAVQRGALWQRHGKSRLGDPVLPRERASGVLPITDTEMTRFNISLQEGVDMVLWTIANAVGGEIFVPKIPSYRVVDLAAAIGPECSHPVIGLRPGEKIHEEMITASDSFNTVDIGPYFAVLPPSHDGLRTHYLKRAGTTAVAEGFSYHSGTNPEFLTVPELRSLIREHVAPDFVA